MGKNRQSNERWSTNDEMKFLDGLGTWRVRPGDREKLIRNYKVSIRQRKDWDFIIVGEVIEYLKGIAI